MKNSASFWKKINTCQTTRHSIYFCLLVCLCFLTPFENFSLIWRRQHFRWRIYNWHSWPLNSEGSFTCHIYCDTGKPFIMVISKDPWHSHLLPSVWYWICHFLFERIRSFPTGNRTPISRMRRECSSSTSPRPSFNLKKTG